MSFKLSAVALGITLAFGAAAAMAANDASIYQNGSGNDSSIEQFTNQNANANVTTYGNDNRNVVRQEDTRSSVATILTNWGSNNDNYIRQQDVNSSNAGIYQAASFGKASITQDGSYERSRSRSWHHDEWTLQPGNQQIAQINQNWGWGNDAAIEQTGLNVNATTNQGGDRNVAVTEQYGNGGNWDIAVVTQVGYANNSYVNQSGNGLTANVYQNGDRNVANVFQKGTGMNATVSQTGYGNNAYVNQR